MNAAGIACFSFGPVIVSRHFGGGSARHVLVTNLNEDGKDDLIPSQMYEDSIKVLLAMATEHPQRIPILSRGKPAPDSGCGP